MHQTALAVDQLSAQLTVPSQQINADCNYDCLFPRIRSSLKHFCQSPSATIGLIQSPHFFDLRTWLNALLPFTGAAKPQLLINSSPARAHAFEIDRDVNALLSDLALHVQALRLDNEAIGKHLPAALITQCQTWQARDFTENYQAYGAIGGDMGIIVDHLPSRESLFGYIHQGVGVDSFSPGAVAKAHGGSLVVAIEALLAQPQLWFELKHAVFEGRYSSQQAQRHQASQWQCASILSQCHLLLWGDAHAIAELLTLDPALRAQAQLEVELPADIPATEASSEALLSLINQQLNIEAMPSLPMALYAPVLQYASRLSEHNLEYSLDIASIIKPLRLAYRNDLHWHDNSLSQGWQQLVNLSNLQQRFSDKGFAEKQLKLWVKGETIGQINGLSVIDFATIGASFGEPLRITATVQQGDGDISDVERKSELAGNIHAKSIMIIQGFLNNQFAIDQHFPFSGNIVFEQSYHEIDGDSASLAGLITLLSAISELPVNQSLAVTGAIDQHGNVLAVGGLNEKIEGFYRVCQLLGAHQGQGVVIPRANLLQLNLSANVIEAVKQGTFHVYAVDHVNQAIELLLGQRAGDNDDLDSVYGIISDKINPRDDNDGLCYRLLRALSRCFYRKDDTPK